MRGPLGTSWVLGGAAFLVFWLAAAVWTVARGPPTVAEAREVEAAVASCMRRPGAAADVWGVLALVRLERELGVPDEARGVLVAAWCIEGGLVARDTLRGDYRGGRARAHGPFQLWPWFRAWCGLADGGADDLVAAGRCYWARVVDRHEARASRCGEVSWRVAEALAANGPHYLRMGCRAESSHWRQLERGRAWARGGER